MENLISNGMSHKKFQSDKNERFLMVGINRFLKINCCFWMVFYTFTEKNLDERKL